MFLTSFSARIRTVWFIIFHIITETTTFHTMPAQMTPPTSPARPARNVEPPHTPPTMPVVPNVVPGAPRRPRLERDNPEHQPIPLELW